MNNTFFFFFLNLCALNLSDFASISVCLYLYVFLSFYFFWSSRISRKALLSVKLCLSGNGFFFLQVLHKLCFGVLVKMVLLVVPNKRSKLFPKVQICNKPNRFVFPTTFSYLAVFRYVQGFYEYDSHKGGNKKKPIAFCGRNFSNPAHIRSLLGELPSLLLGEYFLGWEVHP